MLSEVETGKANPSVDTLYALTGALRVPIAQLFQSLAPVSEPYLEQHPQVSKVERQELSLTGGIRWSRLTPGAEDGIEFLEINYQPGASSGDEMLHHPGREWLYILEGSFALDLGFERHALGPGDSIVFSSETPHRFSNVGDFPGRAIQVNFRASHVGGGH